jgi:hypothetical protein
MLYGALVELQAVLREEQLQTPELPSAETTHRRLAVWFAIQAYYFMQLMDQQTPEPRRISPAVAGRLAPVGKALGRLVGMNIPAPPSFSPMSLVSSFFSIGGAAVGGDNWCRHPDGREVPMEMFRNFPPGGSSELEMTCSHGHSTEYDTQAGNVLYKK